MNTKQQYTKCDFCKYRSGRTCMAKPDSYYCKEALNEFKGTIVLVCHEPEFYNGIVTDVLDAEKWTTKLI